jgi:hypothetical protein
MPKPSGRYCAPKRCYCGECPPYVEPPQGLEAGAGLGTVRPVPAALPPVRAEGRSALPGVLVMRATRYRKCRWRHRCPLCPAPVLTGQSEALVDGTGWCHTDCVVESAAWGTLFAPALATTGARA